MYEYLVKSTRIETSQVRASVKNVESNYILTRAIMALVVQNCVDALAWRTNDL